VNKKNILKVLDFYFFSVYNDFMAIKWFGFFKKMFSVIYFFVSKLFCNINKITLFYKCFIFLAFFNVSKSFRILDLISLKFCNTVSKNLIKGVA